MVLLRPKSPLLAHVVEKTANNDGSKVLRSMSNRISRLFFGLMMIFGASGALVRGGTPDDGSEGFSASHDSLAQVRALSNALDGISRSTNHLVSIDTATGVGTVVGSLRVDVSLPGGWVVRPSRCHPLLEV